MSVGKYTCRFTSIMLSVSIPHTINSGVEVPVLLFEDCAFSQSRLHGVLLIMGYFSMRVKIR